MSRHIPESPLFDCCEACANKDTNTKLNEVVCRGEGSGFENQSVDRFLQGRNEEASPNYCGAWLGGSRFRKETQDI